MRFSDSSLFIIYKMFRVYQKVIKFILVNVHVKSKKKNGNINIIFHSTVWKTLFRLFSNEYFTSLPLRLYFRHSSRREQFSNSQCLPRPKRTQRYYVYRHFVVDEHFEEPSFERQTKCSVRLSAIILPSTKHKPILCCSTLCQKEILLTQKPCKRNKAPTFMFSNDTVRIAPVKSADTTGRHRQPPSHSCFRCIITRRIKRFFFLSRLVYLTEKNHCVYYPCHTRV